jgi:hypothetical protein
MRHPRAERFNAACNIIAEHERKSACALQPQDPLPIARGAPGIDRIDGCGLNPHERFATPWYRQGGVTQL